jgi:hypothetical protein
VALKVFVFHELVPDVRGHVFCNLSLMYEGDMYYHDGEYASYTFLMVFISINSMILL